MQDRKKFDHMVLFARANVTVGEGELVFDYLPSRGSGAYRRFRIRRRSRS